MCHLPKFHNPNLLVGFESSDDGAVYKIDDNTAIIQTVDLFPPMVDDPYQFGQVAAANALSDIYAMGGEPKLCMNILCYPEDMDTKIVGEIMRGGYEKVIEAGAIVAGGHTLKDHEPKYGLCVTGFARPEDILTNSNAKEGDFLILTKALGTGILTTALKADLISGEAEAALVSSMVTLNKRAWEIMKKYPVNSCTDITGFGLLGHAYEMGAGSGVTISLDAAAMPLLPEALGMARMGIIPAGAYTNRAFLEDHVEIGPTVPLEITDIMYDPQTSGGLLISIPEKEAKELLAELKMDSPSSAIVGRIIPKDDHTVIIS